MRWVWNVPVLKVRLHPVVTVHANGLVKEVLLIGPRVLDVVEVGQRPLIRPDGSLGPILVLEDRLDVDHGELLVRDPLWHVLSRGDSLDQLVDDRTRHGDSTDQDRKSTRLNSSH